MSDGPNEVTMPGGRISARLARLLSDTYVHTRLNTSKVTSDIGKEIFSATTNHISDEVRSAMGQIFRDVSTNPETPAELRSLFHNLGSTRGQAWAWIAGSATGAAVGSGLLDVFNNALSPVATSIIKNFPNALLSPEVVAQAFARRLAEIEPGFDLVDEHRRGGLASDRMRFLVELARTRPTVGELLVLLNRRVIDERTFNNEMERLGYDTPWIGRLRGLTEPDLLLPDISAMWNRSIVTDGEAIQLGARIGFSEATVRKSLELGGDPLPPDALGEAFRRGFIDRARFNRGIVQGPLRNEWFDVLERLQFARMSTVDAADAVNQGVINLNAGKRIAHENGLDPEDFGVLIETAGQPPGIDFATEAFNRGFISSAEFDRMFLESRIKNRFLPLLRTMRTRLIPQETVRLLYRNGVYSREQTLQTLLAHGFVPDDAASLLALEERRQDETTRELTRAQIVDFYEEQLFDRATASGLLLGMGYADTSVELMLTLSDIKRVQKFVNSAITRIRSAFVTGKIDETEASIQLDALRVPPSQRDELIVIWDIDRTTVTKTLTASQIRQAVVKQLISRENGIQRLVDQGYDQTDADLFLQLTA